MTTLWPLFWLLGAAALVPLLLRLAARFLDSGPEEPGGAAGEASSGDQAQVEPWDLTAGGRVAGPKRSVAPESNPPGRALRAHPATPSGGRSGGSDADAGQPPAAEPAHVEPPDVRAQAETDLPTENETVWAVAWLLALTAAVLLAVLAVGPRSGGRVSRLVLFVVAALGLGGLYAWRSNRKDDEA